MCCLLAKAPNMSQAMQTTMPISELCNQVITRRHQKCSKKSHKIIQLLDNKVFEGKVKILGIYLFEEWFQEDNWMSIFIFLFKGHLICFSSTATKDQRRWKRLKVNYRGLRLKKGWRGQSKTKRSCFLTF